VHPIILSPDQVQRFWQRVTQGDPDECWLWTGPTDPNGYGRLRGAGRKVLYAHRVAWTLANGPIPGRLFVCHRCDNPPCVNPSHLFLGSHIENMEDMTRKGRRSYGNAGGTRGGPRRGERNGGAKLTAAIVLEIRDSARDGARLSELALRYGLHKESIRRIVLGLRWRHIPLETDTNAG
jgi:hypothetical protein